MATPSQHAAQQGWEAGAGILAALTLALSSSAAFEVFGIAAGGLALYFLREGVPWRKRIFYAIASMAIGGVFAPGLSDLAGIMPGFPASLRPGVGFLAVCAAVPFVTVWRAGWRRLADHPEMLWDWALARLPASWRRSRPVSGPGSGPGTGEGGANNNQSGTGGGNV